MNTLFLNEKKQATLPFIHNVAKIQVLTAGLFSRRPKISHGPSTVGYSLHTLNAPSHSLCLLALIKVTDSDKHSLCRRSKKKNIQLEWECRSRHRPNLHLEDKNEE